MNILIIIILIMTGHPILAFLVAILNGTISIKGK